VKKGGMAHEVHQSERRSSSTGFLRRARLGKYYRRCRRQACTMNDPDNSKQEKLPLQFRDTAKVIKRAAEYQRDNANEIHVRIPKDTEGFTSLTFFDITLNTVPISDEPIDLLECWIDWSPTQPVEWTAIPSKSGVKYAGKLPMIIRDIVPSEEVEAIPGTNNQTTILRVKNGLPSSTIRIEFKVPNVFFSLPGRAPFDHKRLTLNIKVLKGAASSVLHLTYPDSISMRARADNSEYQSLILSTGEDNYYRKATFFPQPDINIRYTFGTSAGLELLAPGIPPLQAGLALLGLGFTLLLIYTGHASEPHDESLFHLAAVVFAGSLIPAFLEMFRIKRLFSRSAALAEKASWNGISRVFFGTLHAVAIFVVALTLIWYSDFESGISRFMISVGAILTVGTIIFYFLPLKLGTYQKYMCDRCEKRIWIRKWFPKLHPKTRQSLCSKCYRAVAEEHLEYKPTTPNVSSRSGDERSSSERSSSDRIADLNSGTVSTEQDAWNNVLGGDVKVDTLPNIVTPQIRQSFKNMGLELRFIPSLDHLGTLKDLQSKRSVEEYLEGLKQRYPKWRRLNELNKNEIADYKVRRNLQELYWVSVRNEKFPFPEFSGRWVAIETNDNPEWVNEHIVREFARKSGSYDDGLRMSWNNVNAAIYEEKKRVLSKVGLPAERADIRLLDALEWNLLANREGWGKTDMYEWTKTKFIGFGHTRIVIVGKFVFGGAGCVSTSSPVSYDDDVGFRAAIVLDP